MFQPTQFIALAAAEISESNGLFQNLGGLLTALWDVTASLLMLVAPWLPLVAWIAFWLFAVNWVKFRAVLLSGAWTGVMFLGLMIVLVWGTVSPPPDGVHYLLGLTLSNFVGKTVYVTVLFCIMFLCGSIQLAGYPCSCFPFNKENEEEAAH